MLKSLSTLTGPAISGSTTMSKQELEEAFEYIYRRANEIGEKKVERWKGGGGAPGPKYTIPCPPKLKRE